MCLIADNNPLSSGGAAGCSDDGAVSSTVATGRDFISTEVSASGCVGAGWTGAAWTGAWTAAGGIGAVWLEGGASEACGAGCGAGCGPRSAARGGNGRVALGVGTSAGR